VTDALEQQRLSLTQAIGECITAWSFVEIHLGEIYRWAIGMAQAEIAWATLTAPRSFEARASMIQAAMAIKLRREAPLADWNLLFNYALVLSRKRNEIAHAAMMGVEGGKEMALEPYFVMTRPKDKFIREPEVRERIMLFNELSACLMWFMHQILLPSPASKPKRFVSPVPDLLRRLRTEDDQRREEQRRQQKQPRR
jgi:hypothetical protein